MQTGLGATPSKHVPTKKEGYKMTRQHKHKWRHHPVLYRDNWPKNKRWIWETCSCGKFRNVGAK